VIGLGRHIRRMREGLRSIGIPHDPAGLGEICEGLLSANSLDDAFVYVQVTRGTPDLAKGPVRSRVPQPGMRPTVFAYCTPLPALESLDGPVAKAAVTGLDSRWEHGHIKSVSLLANIMAAMEAGLAGADEAILIRREAETALVTEGTYTNVVVATARREREAGLPAPFDRFDVATRR